MVRMKQEIVLALGIDQNVTEGIVSMKFFTKYGKLFWLNTVIFRQI